MSPSCRGAILPSSADMMTPVYGSNIIMAPSDLEDVQQISCASAALLPSRWSPTRGFDLLLP